MQINILAIFLASVAQFICGMIWYAPLFGKIWGTIHGHDNLSTEEQKEAMKKMPPYFFLQFVSSILTSIVLSMYFQVLPADWNPYGIAFFAWLGFILPAQYGAVVFGGTKPRWIVKKLAIMAAGSMVCLVAATAVLQWLM
jgi:hypothetical protein